MKLIKQLTSVIMLAFVLFSCEKAENSTIDETSAVTVNPLENGVCQPTTTNIMAGKNTVAGTITITNDLVNIYVTYTTTGGWVMGQTQLYVGPLSGLPVNKMGNPMIGLFPYKTTHNPYVTTFTYTIPRAGITDACIIVAAHAEVILVGPNGQVIKTETGWGAGPKIANKGSWAMYTKFCICDESNPPS